MASSRRGRFSILLISILLLLLLRPFLSHLPIARALSTALFSLAIFSALYGVSRPRWAFHTGLLLVVPAIVTAWLHYASSDVRLLIARDALMLLVFAFTAVVVLLHVLRADRITAEQTSGAVAAYLLLGIVWGLAYSILDTVAPGSLSIGRAGSAADAGGIGAYVYYSFVTLTTLGYGDVTPVSDRARSLSMVEAVIGQLYLAVLIAKLVGMQVSAHSRR